MNDSTTLDRLHQHFAHQLGCKPEDLAKGNRQLVTCDLREEGNPTGPATPLYAVKRENGWVVSVISEAYSSAQNVLNHLPAQSDPLSEPSRRRLHETIGSVTPVYFYTCGLQLYTDVESFRPYSVHPVRRLTPEDLPALRVARHSLATETERLEAGDVFAVVEEEAVRSYALILRTSSEVREITAATEAPYRNRGYAKSVVSAATDAVLKAGRIPLYSCDEYNVASRRVAEALGYRKYADDFVCLSK